MSLVDKEKEAHETQRWAWVEVSREALRHNVAALKGLCRKEVLFMAVVKADAYGHSVSEALVSTLRSAGADRFGVATFAEAAKLRALRAADGVPVLLLSEPPPESADLCVALEITPTVCTRQFAVALSDAALRRGVQQVARYHLNVNTGMHRIGVSHADAAAEALWMKEHAPHARMEGMYTHFASAGSDAAACKLQTRRFRAAVDAVRAAGVDPGIVHACNTAATVLCQDAHFDMVRCGVGIYGLHPSPETAKAVDLVPAMAVYARATFVHTVPAGESVSYSGTWTAPHDTRVATLPLGYADGLHRVLSNKVSVTVARTGASAKQVGNITMDQTIVALPAGDGEEEEVQPGELFVVAGGTGVRSLDNLAALAGTINYEMACAFGMRMPRILVS